MMKLFQFLMCPFLVATAAGLVLTPASAALLDEAGQQATAQRTVVWETGLARAPLLLAQMNTPMNAPLNAPLNAPGQTGQLEEEVRQLNGKVEELNFQLLEMQEKMRKMQEDNEFRFQELEQRVDAAGSGKKRLGKSQPSETSNSAEGSKSDEGSGGARPTIGDLIANSPLKQSKKRVIDGVEIFDPKSELNADNLDDKVAGSLGTMTFDAQGNVVDSNVGRPIQLVPGPQNGSANPSLPDNANALFDLGYQYIQGGEYDRSAEAFEEFTIRYRDDPRISEANFWLGESYFSLGQYDEAARVFLDNHKQFPNSRLGAQNLLKLGVSLAGLNQRELACATYAEIPKKYPDISRAIRNRVDQEQSSAKCKG